MRKNDYLKSMLIIVMLGTMSIFTLTATEGPNLLLNGDFEITEAPWLWSKNNADITMNEINENSINGGTCRMPGAAAARNINQKIALSHATTYLFNFTGRIQNSVGVSGSVENNNATKGGPGTITATIFPLGEDGITVLPDALATFTTQSNANTVVSGEMVIPEGVPGVQVKISKDWNIAYIDDVSFRLKVDVWSGTRANTASSFRVISDNNNSISLIATEKLSSIRVINICGQTVLSTSEVSNHIVLPEGVKGVLIVEAKTESGATLLSRFINK